jgi:CMP-N,N'-diacetyllegionaminic acid synthase
MFPVLGVVTARGGSKGIPRKNLAILAGRSLLAHTADVALRARRLTRVVLSTDDEEIALAGRALGLDVPFLRPAELARDDTPTVPVLQDLVGRLELAGHEFSAVFTLQPTNPLRTVADVDGAVALLQETGADSVISFTPVGEKHPARMKSIDADGWVHDPPFAESFEGQPRQSLAPLFLRDGSVYVTRRDVLMIQGSLKGSRCRAWHIPALRSCNIDTPLDLCLAEALLRLQDSR